jgi:hypothetical protein
MKILEEILYWRFGTTRRNGLAVQEAELVFRATLTIHSTRGKMERATAEQHGKIIRGRSIVVTFERFNKKLVTEATNCD